LPEELAELRQYVSHVPDHRVVPQYGVARLAAVRREYDRQQTVAVWTTPEDKEYGEKLHEFEE
jgi:hypothetical protein